MAGKRRGIIAVVLALFVVLIYVLFGLFQGNNAYEESALPLSEPEPEVLREYGLAVDSFRIVVGSVPRNQVFGELFKQLGALPGQIGQLQEASKELFDLRKVRAGNVYKAFYPLSSPDSLASVVYEHTATEYYRFDLSRSVVVLKGEKPVTIQRRYAEARISTSLWNAMKEKQLSPLLGLELSNIYAWTVDFFGLQKGDQFSAIYDALYVDTTFIGIGQIWSARFTSNDSIFDAYYFVQDSVGSYWNEKGESLRKAFLKAPLSFSRISSGFSYARRHPVLKVVRAHTGIDYAAPRGTPVMSIGDGTVIARSYQGGGGNTVKIRHNSVYTTAYLHLSGYAKGLKVGSRVKQSDVIGYVGSTGLSTGPHLDFRVWQNGTPINPLKMESPPVEPIKESYRAPFDSIVHLLRTELESKRPINPIATDTLPSLITPHTPTTSP